MRLLEQPHLICLDFALPQGADKSPLEVCPERPTSRTQSGGYPTTSIPFETIPFERLERNGRVTLELLPRNRKSRSVKQS